METCTLQSKLAVKIQHIPASIKIKKTCPAFRTVGVFHFQMMKTREQTDNIKPKILKARMKHGQKPELRSVVSGVGTVYNWKQFNIIPFLSYLKLEQYLHRS